MTATNPGNGIVSRLADHPLARVVAYYVVLAVGVVLLYQWRPELPGVFTTGSFQDLARRPDELVAPAAPLAGSHPLAVAKEAAIAMMGAYLLMLPVAWVYIFTRAKRGYLQSLVQTLVILPIVVAGVVILVKNSLALAFGLGGIVGAIAFRNRLEDTKDAVHVFLAIGVGLAAGVQVMALAAVLSLFYNLINVVLWWTDFGRVPAGLGGPVARRRVDRIRQERPRGDALVSQVDTLLLKSMSPEQLEVLADRARKRRRRLAEQIGVAITGEMRRPRFDGTIRIVLSGGSSDAIKALVEPILEGQAKAWQLEASTVADAGRTALLYKVRFKKTIPGPLLLEAVRRAVAGRVGSVELV
jgi:hypothetical protein